jgi:aminoglycoside/choline kinase family phosphotransferase
VLDWTVRYWERAKRAGLPVAADFGSFYADFEWMGLQRHLKVLGIFAAFATATGRAVTSRIRRASWPTRAPSPPIPRVVALARLLDRLEGPATAVAGVS